MALEQKLSLKLSQRLVMTPSLQQAIKLLQMTRLELQGVLAQELVENPLLEESEEVVEEEATLDREDAQQEASEAEDGELDHEKSIEDIDLEAYFNDYWESSPDHSVYEPREGPPLENSASREPDLYDHLLWQLHMTEVSARQREIAEMIIGNLDPDGFLVASVDEIARLMAASPAQAGDGRAAGPDDRSSDLPAIADEGGNGPLGAPLPAQVPSGDGSRDEGPGDDSAPPADGEGDETWVVEAIEPAVPPPPAEVVREVEEALALVRSFDPPGVACASLRESLLWQLDARGEPENSLVRRIVDESWEIFLRRQFPALARLHGVELTDLQPAVEAIKSLETRPGRRFNHDQTHYIEPDVAVIKVGDEYVIQLNDDGLPRLRVSRAYRRMLSQMRRDGRQADARQYIQEKMRSAMWLIKSLDQRHRTIYKVADSIVKQQQAFFERGIDHLRPMVLRDVADDIEMHESTVSRVVSNKYMHTPRGLFPMKFFFHSGIDRDSGEDISSLSVKRKIEQLIQAEDPKRPLSDSALTRALKREGINIARRTVAKYRDESGIPSSTDRKQIF